MSVRASGAPGRELGVLEAALPALDELGGLASISPGADAATLRLEPLESAPPAAVAPPLTCGRPLDPRARTLLDALGARAREIAAHAPSTLGPHQRVLVESAHAVGSMVAALRALEALEHEAALGLRRGALRA